MPSFHAGHFLYHPQILTSPPPPPPPAGADLSLSPGDGAALRYKQYIDIYIQSFIWTLGTNY